MRCACSISRYFKAISFRFMPFVLKKKGNYTLLLIIKLNIYSLNTKAEDSFNSILLIIMSESFIKWKISIKLVFCTFFFVKMPQGRNCLKKKVKFICL